ncbi:MAG: alpha/beta hydrolase family protein [Acidimicrobiales bacterium]
MSVALVSLVMWSLGFVNATATASGDYRDPAFLQHDLDNISRASLEAAQVGELLDPTYLQALLQIGGETWLANVDEQLDALASGRAYLGLGQLIPGGAVGDPVAYHEVEPLEANFVTRTGAELQGHLFWDGEPGPHPGVVITSGSIQGVQQGYWWAARTLARSGYVVLAWDAQGQGDSETFGHDPGSTVPNLAGFPSQQDANFVDGTIDALRFFLSSASEPYLPAGWTTSDVEAVRAQGQSTILWSNPLAGVLDATRIGLAGHSLGGYAVAVVQQCSDERTAWHTEPACGGRPYPIRAVVSWDGFAGGVTPVVPTMMQWADGPNYFLNPLPAPSAPDPGGANFRSWRDAGVDSYTFSVRGGTHVEWWVAPLVGLRTSYGNQQVDFYTLAWFERYLRPEPERQAVGAATLLTGPVPDRLTAGADEYPWRANFFSARYYSGFAFTDTVGRLREADDLRAYAGLSAIGDWAGANRDQPAARQPN